jgi:hypothetical protein
MEGVYNNNVFGSFLIGNILSKSFGNVLGKHFLDDALHVPSSLCMLSLYVNGFSSLQNTISLLPSSMPLGPFGTTRASSTWSITRELIFNLFE